MKSSNSRLFLGLVIGTAAGFAICYLLDRENRENLLKKINDSVDNTKKKIGEAIDEGIDGLDSMVDKVSTLTQSAVERIKAHNIEAGDE